MNKNISGSIHRVEWLKNITAGTYSETHIADYSNQADAEIKMKEVLQEEGVIAARFVFIATSTVNYGWRLAK